jgi:hypothetical protein
MTLKQIRPGVGDTTCGPGERFSAKSSTPKFKAPQTYGQVIVLPLPRDLVRVGGKLCRLSPRLQARIAKMARRL